MGILLGLCSHINFQFWTTKTRAPSRKSISLFVLFGDIPTASPASHVLAPIWSGLSVLFVIVAHFLPLPHSALHGLTISVTSVCRVCTTPSSHLFSLQLSFNEMINPRYVWGEKNFLENKSFRYVYSPLLLLVLVAMVLVTIYLVIHFNEYTDIIEDWRHKSGCKNKISLTKELCLSQTDLTKIRIQVTTKKESSS